MGVALTTDGGRGRDARRSRMPTRARYAVHFRFGGRIATLDVLWSTRSRWQRRPEASDPAWSWLPIGPFALAFRLHA